MNLQAPEGPAWEFTVLFAIVLVGPIVVQRFRLPGIIGLLIGGYLIGPNGLEIISAGNTTIPDVGKLGLLYLMFVAGVELDLTLIQLHRRSVVIFSLLTFSVPMLFGTAVGLLLGWSAPAALLLGSLLASHTLLTYPIVRRAGLASNPAAATAIGATVVTDTLALVVLAAVAGTETGSGSTVTIMLQLVIGLVVLGLATLWLTPKVASIALRRLGGEKTVRYLVAVCAFLAAASLSEVFGIEGIVGAFFAGLALNRLIPNGGPLMDRVEFFGSAVFIPVFMVSVGLILDPAVMAEPSTLGLAALLIIACMGGKFIAAYLTVPLLGFTRDESSLVFSLTSPQAAATLAAVIVGLNIGLFGESVVNASLVVILFSVVLSTVVAERAASRVPPPAGEERPLGAHVAVAIEAGQAAEGAFRVASWIAAPEGGAATVIVVDDPRAPVIDGEVRERLDREAVAAGLDADLRVVHDSSYAHGVLNAATAAGASVLIATSGQKSATAAGGWAEAVSESSSIPTAILRGEIESLDSLRVMADDECPGGSALAERIGQRLSTRSKGEMKVERDLESIPVPRPGELLIRPVESWELLAGLPDVPAGAAVIVVPDPTPVAPIPVSD